ncbi:MAG: PAS domain-containing protein, partial [Treponema sp.]|nr:PAS domain-containing protein [Treponema sp.]
MDEIVEELDDLEEVPDEVDVFSIIDSTNAAKFSSENDPYTKSLFPVLFINKKLQILYANHASEKLFHVVKNIGGQYLTDLFGRFFNLEDIRLIRETLLTGNNGYCWKGEIKIKSRELVTTLTKIYLFPIDISDKEPTEFIIMFDDITEENRKLLRGVFLSLLEASKLKDNDTGKHIIRVNLYSKCLASELYNKKGYDRVDADFIDNI